MSERLSKQLKRLVIERAHGNCEYCHSQEQFAPTTFSVEHIIPRSVSGTTAADNLALSCQECNNHKYNKIQAIDPTSGEHVPLYHPRQHLWSDHFIWNDDYSKIEGISAIGRATVETLQLNRTGVVNLRRVLFEMGAHPPPSHNHDQP